MRTADCGGSSGSRVRLWKVELQKPADETGVEIHVCHLPPGTGKWNRIEYRLVSFISQNRRGRPLVSHEVIVDLIAATTTIKGLKSPRPTRPKPLSGRYQDVRQGALNGQPSTQHLPRRVKLQHHT
jgi:hypothetical protein